MRAYSEIQAYFDTSLFRRPVGFRRAPRYPGGAFGGAGGMAGAAELVGQAIAEGGEDQTGGRAQREGQQAAGETQDDQHVRLYDGAVVEVGDTGEAGGDGPGYVPAGRAAADRRRD